MASSLETRSLKVDFHTHILPREVPDFKEQFGYEGGWVTFNHDQSKVDTKGNCRMMKDGEFFREIEPNCWSLEHRVVDMDRDGIDVHVLCTVPVMFSYWAKPADTCVVAQFLNDDLARTVAENPTRFIGLGTLPMNSPEGAVLEMQRCVRELGFRGVQIGSHVNDWNLDAPELLPFWEEAERLQCVVFGEFYFSYHMTEYSTNIRTNNDDLYIFSRCFQSTLGTWS